MLGLERSLSVQRTGLDSQHPNFVTPVLGDLRLPSGFFGYCNAYSAETCMQVNAHIHKNIDKIFKKVKISCSTIHIQSHKSLKKFSNLPCNFKFDKKRQKLHSFLSIFYYSPLSFLMNSNVFQAIMAWNFFLRKFRKLQ